MPNRNKEWAKACETEIERLQAINADLLVALIDLRLASTAHGVAADNPANVKARAVIAKARKE